MNYIPTALLNPQQYTSKNTSINKVKLPAIYNKIDFRSITCNGEVPLLIVDYGCGRYYKETQHALAQKMGADIYFNYLPVDPYWFPLYLLSLEKEVIKWKSDYPNGAVVCICSNVLNVIKEDEIVQSIKDRLFHLAACTFFTVYEGDKSGVGKRTKNDCWQRNQKLKDYIGDYEVTRKGVLCKKGVASFIL